jgi:signal transduction histidine kinase
VCRAPTDVIPTERCASLASTAEQLRELSALEQRARSLEHEIAQRTEVEAALRDALAREQHAREEAERAVRFNEMFAGMLGHDLRNPLGAISMGASYIARSSTNEKLTRSATRILTSTDRMARMIEQLLEFSRIRAGGTPPLRPIRFDLAELCSRVKDELEATHPEGSIAIELEGSAIGTWDYEQLLRAFSTIAGNAISHDAAAQGVTIRIDGRDPERVAAQIHNAGAIAPDTMAVLFEPFRGTSRRHHTQGLGLGLFIARQIVHAHGGSIEAASSAASGTSLRIDLPRSTPPRPAAGSTP